MVKKGEEEEFKRIVKRKLKDLGFRILAESQRIRLFPPQRLDLIVAKEYLGLHFTFLIEIRYLKATKEEDMCFILEEIGRINEKLEGRLDKSKKDTPETEYKVTLVILPPFRESLFSRFKEELLKLRDDLENIDLVLFFSEKKRKFTKIILLREIEKEELLLREKFFKELFKIKG